MTKQPISQRFRGLMAWSERHAPLRHADDTGHATTIAIDSGKSPVAAA
jgi:hypothetical protein